MPFTVESQMKMFKTIVLLVTASGLTGCLEQEEQMLAGYVENTAAKLATTGQGRIAHIHVKRGDKVRKGQKLLALTNTSQQQAYALAKAKLAFAKAEMQDYVAGSDEESITVAMAQLRAIELKYELARKTTKRLEILKTKQFVSETDWDNATNNEQTLKQQKAEAIARLSKIKSPLRQGQLVKLQATIDIAKAQYESAKWNLDQQDIYAPFAGVIEDLYFREGEVVSPTQSILSIIQEKEAIVIFYLPYNKMKQAYVGMPVNISISSQQQKVMLAKITFIATQPEFTPPVVYGDDANNKYVYLVRARLMNPMEKLHIHPGQAVNVTLSSHD